MPEVYDIAQLGLGDHSEIRELLAQCSDIEARRYRDGEFLMREGEESSDLFIILDGACVVERPGAGPGAPPSILATISADPLNPAILGEMAYFGTQRRSASVRSAGCTHTLCLNSRHIETIVESFPGLLKLIFRQFTQRLMEANQTLKEMQARFTMAAQRRMANAGERLFTEGEAASSLFQLVIGAVRLESGGEVTLATPESLPRGFLDFEAFLSQGRHRATATVEGSAFLVVVDGTCREAVVRSCPELVLECWRQRAPQSMEPQGPDGGQA